MKQILCVICFDTKWLSVLFKTVIIQSDDHNADIGKSTGPRSSTGENSGGPMKTLIVPVLLSGKKFL